MTDDRNQMKLQGKMTTLARSGAGIYRKIQLVCYIPSIKINQKKFYVKNVFMFD